MRGLALGEVTIEQALAAIEGSGKRVTLTSGAWHGEIREWSIKRSCDQIDITTFGDVVEHYIPGRERCEIELTTFFDQEIGWPPSGALMMLDETIGMWRISGQFLVTHYEVITHLNALTEVRITATSVGPVVCSQVMQQQDEPLGSAFRRGIALGGL